MDFPIRIVTLPLSRWKEYRDLRIESLKEEPQAFRTTVKEAEDTTKEEWKQILSNAEKEDKDLLFFAEDNHKLVGIMGSFFHKNPELEGIAMIYGVYVNSLFREKGIATQLLQKILERLQTIPSLKTARLMVNTNQAAAIKLYERFGFKKVKEEELMMADGQLHTEFVMEKPLQFSH